MGGRADSFLMKALRQLGFLKLPFRQVDPAQNPEDERVLALFRNRAELKKAYGELQEEIYRLKDRIKQQEGATVRVQEMLGALDVRLRVPAFLLCSSISCAVCGRRGARSSSSLSGTSCVSRRNASGANILPSTIV